MYKSNGPTFVVQDQGQAVRITQSLVDVVDQAVHESVGDGSGDTFKLNVFPQLVHQGHLDPSDEWWRGDEGLACRT